jgi:hypothetical protein
MMPSKEKMFVIAGDISCPGTPIVAPAANQIRPRGRHSGNYRIQSVRGYARRANGGYVEKTYRPLRNTAFLPGTLKNLFYPPEENEYTYFRRAGERPFAAGDDITKAAWSADAAMLAYARYGAVRMTDADLDDNFKRAGLTYRKIGGTAENWNAPGTQAVFASCDQFAILAFRGTEADDPADCAYDADLLLVHEPDYRVAARDPRPVLGHLAWVTHLFSPPCLVHQGFQRALREVWEPIHQAVTDYRTNHPAAEIRLTGHSLGGALAILAFSRFADPHMSVCTFGCPRVGNGAFRDRVVSNPGSAARFVNRDDAVAHVPLEDLFYRHAPVARYRFDADGLLGLAADDAFAGDVDSVQAAILGLPDSVHLGNLDTIPAPPAVVDHSPARYCFRLWDCV